MTRCIMTIIVSILVIILVRVGYVNGDELYPILVVEDIAQNQPEWSSSDYIEPLQEKPRDEESLVYSFPQSDPIDEIDLAWMKTNIVDRYKFKKDPKKDMWISQPNFKSDLGTKSFKDAAQRVKAFFERNNDWDTTKKNPAFRTKDSCINLLYITAARYLLVTDILYDESNGKLVACRRTPDKKLEIPVSGVCYPEPYGTASCTSDYDVGLVGKEAGVLTEKFNLYFEKNFGKPSELVFDTNVYAFTLEFAMPFLFKGLPAKFVSVVAKNEQTVDFKMQELASSYYKVFKYNEAYFNVLKDGAVRSMVNAPESKGKLVFWLEEFSELNKKVSMRPKAGRTPAEFRREHNKKYQELVKDMSAKGGYNPAFLGTLAKALIYAAEAYHTRGAIRHVVGGTQMKIIDTSKSLSNLDLWVSMIENWGEANKEYNHCGSAPLEVCFLKMSKYMWRMFNAMRLIRKCIPPKDKPGLVHFGENFADPEFAMQMWLDYKKQGATAIPRQKGNVMQFLRQFGCNQAALGQQLSVTCVNKMNDKVNAYNKKLASLERDKAERPCWRP